MYPKSSSKIKFALYDVEKLTKFLKLTDEHSWILGKSCQISPVSIRFGPAEQKIAGLLIAR